MSSAAVMTASWARRGRRGAITTLTPGPMAPAGNVYSGDAGGGPIGLTVEIYLGGAGWEDVSRYCYYRDMVRIQNRGRANETVLTSALSAQTCTLTLNNRDGRFTPTNPNGPYYGLIGRNTPLRVSRYANGVRWFRFHGEVTAWPTTSDISGSDVYEQITVAGMVRRLQQGSAPLQSVLRRGIPNDPRIAAYWPCEDTAGSTQIAAAIGTAPMAVAGTLNAAQYSGLIPSNPIPTLGTDSWRGPVGAGTTGTSGRMSFFIQIPASSSIVDKARIASFTMIGQVSRIDVLYRTAGPGIELIAYQGNVVVEDSGTQTFLLDLAENTRITINWDLSGSGGTNLNFGWYSIGQTAATGPGTYTLTQLISGVQTVQIAPDGTMAGASVGHVWVQATSTELVYGGIFSWTSAYNSDNPIWRFIRLCSEQQVNFEVANGTLGTDYGLVGMGYQLVNTFLSLLQECADTDLAIAYEARDQLAMAIRPRVSMYNQTPRLILDHSQHQLAAPLNPMDDDAFTVNDIIVTRTGGSSVEATQTTGALNTSPPPAGVGPYQNSVSISLNTDSALGDAAGWRLYLGTVPTPRYPQIVLNLHHPQFTGNPLLLAAALATDIGDFIQIINPPPTFPPDPIDVLAQGYSEVLGTWEHQITFNSAPADPYKIGIFDDPVQGRYDTDGSTLTAALSTALNANPTFSVPVPGKSAVTGSLVEWTNVSGTITSIGGDSGTPLPAGANVPWGVLLTPDGTLNNCAVQGASSAGYYVAALPGQTYQISALVYSPGGYGTVEIGFDWYDVNQSYLFTSSITTVVAAGAWMALNTSQLASTGSGIAFLRPRIGEKASPTSANTLYVVNAPVWSGTVSVATSTATSPVWTTTGGDFPFDIAVGGERMTVTNITGSSSPQAFTVTRAVNGVIKPQTAGTDVRLWQPTIIAL